MINFLLTTMHVLRKTARYWKTLFYMYHLEDIAVVNAFIIFVHRNGCRTISENDFCDSLVFQIIKEYGRAKRNEPGPGQPKRNEPGPGQPKRNEPGPGQPKRNEPGPGQPKRNEPGPGQPKRNEPGPGQPKRNEPGPGQPKRNEPGPGQPKGKCQRRLPQEATDLRAGASVSDVAMR